MADAVGRVLLAQEEQQRHFAGLGQHQALLLDLDRLGPQLLSRFVAARTRERIDPAVDERIVESARRRLNVDVGLNSGRRRIGHQQILGRRTEDIDTQSATFRA